MSLAREREFAYRRRLSFQRAAARQMEQLACDMLEYERIGLGEFRR